MGIAFRGGYLETGSVWNAPIRFHWSIPIGAFVLGRFRFVPWYWAAFLMLVIVHELGHAIMVRLARARVIAVEAHGGGGFCHWEGHVSELWRALISWGGVLAQLAAFVVAVVVIHVLGPPQSQMAAGLEKAFTDGNMWMAAMNLIPIPGLDGAEAWKIIPVLRRMWRRRREASTARARLEKRMKATLAAHDEIDALDAADAGPNRAADEVLERVFGKKTGSDTNRKR
ncbi:MAG: hypothetical protein JWO86_4879 [Myxococcaceae bacterium]|nr:hypothetical protein [Myxococcaceae bacterium]